MHHGTLVSISTVTVGTATISGCTSPAQLHIKNKPLDDLTSLTVSAKNHEMLLNGQICRAASRSSSGFRLPMTNGMPSNNMHMSLSCHLEILRTFLRRIIGLQPGDLHREKSKSMKLPMCPMHRGVKSAWQRERWTTLTADATQCLKTNARRRQQKYTLTMYTSVLGEARRLRKC